MISKKTMNKRIESKIIELRAPKVIKVNNCILDTGNLNDKEIPAGAVFTALSPGTEIASYRADSPLRIDRIYP
jgi:hypothetical protein